MSRKSTRKAAPKKSARKSARKSSARKSTPRKSVRASARKSSARKSPARKSAPLHSGQRRLLNMHKTYFAKHKVRILWKDYSKAEIRAIIREAGVQGDAVLVAKAKAALARRS